MNIVFSNSFFSFKFLFLLFTNATRTFIRMQDASPIRAVRVQCLAQRQLELGFQLANHGVSSANWTTAISQVFRNLLKQEIKHLSFKMNSFSWLVFFSVLQYFMRWGHLNLAEASPVLSACFFQHVGNSGKTEVSKAGIFAVMPITGALAQNERQALRFGTKPFHYRRHVKQWAAKTVVHNDQMVKPLVPSSK